MNNKGKLAILFIDALPYFKSRNIGQILNLYRLIPGLGYSVNQHYELLYGKTPDDVEFFGEWSLECPKKFDTFKFRFHKIIDSILWKLKLNLIRKGYRKIILGLEDMIPLVRREYFLRKGTYAFRELAKEDFILYNTQFRGYIEELDRTLPRNEEKRMETMFNKMFNIAKNTDHPLLFAINIMDHIGHKYGPESSEYDSFLDLFAKKLLDLLTFLNKNGFHVILFSDHGMSPYKAKINLADFEHYFGRFFGKYIVYFYDSLYFRAWIFDSFLYTEIEEFLGKLPGKVLSSNDRKQFGVVHEEHGHVIFVLNEGFTFHPNYFGYSAMKGYHGYLPEFERQHGIAAFSQNFKIDPLFQGNTPKYLNSIDFSIIIKHILGANKNV
ncbi:MAG: hypothetical protein PWQ73_242 [Petrotoga sp.]|nr:hypothetical protein [Petrotoga sp.]